MKATLRTVPLRKCRNKQCGDWRIRAWTQHRKQLHILAAQVPNDERSELAVLVHELIEAWMYADRCSPDRQEEVSRFDALFEEERERGLHPEGAEAGDDPRAPYFLEHQMATLVERAVCQALGLPWAKHEQNIALLFR